MKLNKYSLALILGLSTLVSCSDRMDLLNPNQQTSSTFGFNADDLEECVIAAYNHIRMEGSYARVGYTIDVCRGDEAWNSSQVWYLPFDDLNAEVHLRHYVVALAGMVLHHQRVQLHHFPLQRR